jgi:hypothetical protein
LSVLLDALRPRIIPRLSAVSGPTVSGLASGLVGGAYVPIPAAPELKLDFRDASIIATYYAADVSRFASASIETIQAAALCSRNDGPVAWSILQLYYAAFYAAHAILRILGCSCTYFPSTTTARVLRVLSAVGVISPFPLSGGLYGCTVMGSELTVTPLSGTPNGGTHELFWRRFVQEIEVLSSAVLAGPLPATDAQEAAARLIALRDTLSGGAAQGSWLSRLRNEVQYRHGLNIWFPERLQVRERQRLVRLIASWVADDPKHTIPRGSAAGDLFEFASACLFLVGTCRGLILDLAVRAPRRGRSFVDYGPAKLLRHNEQ